MRLEDISRLDEALELDKQYLVIESLLADIIDATKTKFQTYIDGHNKVVEKLGLLHYVKTARQLNVSLLDDSPEANDWWESAVNIINRKHGGKATKKERAELITKARAKIGPMINRDLENTQNKLADLYARRTGNSSANVDRMFEILFGTSESEKAPKPRRRRKSHYYESKVYEEGWGQTISTAIDMLDPKKRIYKGAEIVRSSNNERIATIAISLLSRQLDTINVDRKLKMANRAAKKPPIPATPLTNKYKMAMFINKCMLDASKGINKDKGQEYWMNKIQSKAKRMGVRIRMNHLPAKPYPRDFDEFRQQYGPKPALRPGQRA
jgi:hypothetical protein